MKDLVITGDFTPPSTIRTFDCARRELVRLKPIVERATDGYMSLLFDSQNHTFIIRRLAMKDGHSFLKDEGFKIMGDAKDSAARIVRVKGGAPTGQQVVHKHNGVLGANISAHDFLEQALVTILQSSTTAMRQNIRAVLRRFGLEYQPQQRRTETVSESSHFESRLEF